MTTSGPDREALERLLSRTLSGARVVRCERLDGIGASAVARKEGGYARAWRVSASDDSGQLHDFVFRYAGADEFGHDRRADRAANLLLAFDTFGAMPDHVRALDFGFETSGELRTLHDCEEPYLVTTYAEGRLYAEDLRRIAAEGSSSPADLQRCDALARWLAALHTEQVMEPVAWKRAVRDLLGHGEGIFGIVDAYGPDVPAAPPARLAAIERRCLEWRWRLRDHPERLRRTHGDFHPFNIVFSPEGRFTLLDASRGCKGDPADDVTALTINYVFFALQAPQAWRRGFAPLWWRFWEDYLETSGDNAVLSCAAPFLAWRALVLCCPRFYPDLPAPARDALLSFAERVLDADAFSLPTAEDLFA